MKRHPFSFEIPLPKRSFNWPLWLPTPGNIIFTLLVAGLLIMNQNVWSASTLENTPSSSSNTINYQGRLADSSGNALSGSYNLQFAIYDAATGGNRIWGAESHLNTSVNDGLFSVGLGSQTAGGIPATTWNGDSYLEINVNGEALSPRELIRSVPIAGMALTVPNESVTTEKLADRAVTSDKQAPRLRTVPMQLWSDNDGGVTINKHFGNMPSFSVGHSLWARGVVKLPHDWVTGTGLRIGIGAQSHNNSQTVAPRVYWATLNHIDGAWEGIDISSPQVTIGTGLSDVTLVEISSSDVTDGDSIVIVFRFPNNTQTIDVTGLYLEYMAQP